MTVDNIFDIQSEITRHIVTAIRGELTDEEATTLAQQPTDNLDAYEAYLKAKAYLNDPLYSQDKYINAEEWLKKAVASDPAFALAWAQLVVTNGQAIWLGYDESPERQQAVLEALENAEKFGPDLPETIAAKAEYLYRINADFHAAELLFAQASQAKPGDSDLLVRLATTERRTGHFEQAITHFQMAIDLDPANLQARSVLLETLAIMGAFERAIPLADLWIEKYPDTEIFKTWKAQMLPPALGKVKEARALLAEIEPNLGVAYIQTATSILLYDRDYQGLIDILSRPPLSHMDDTPAFRALRLEMLGRAYRYMGDSANADKFTDAAIDACMTFSGTTADGRSYIFSVLAAAHANAGQFDKALVAANRALELKPESADSLMGPSFSSTRARILGMAGQREASLAEIERLLNTPAGLNRWDLALNPDWDFFRDDERFNALARPENIEEVSQ
jgi:tetratricopeptide (TPR) repeat protein